MCTEKDIILVSFCWTGNYVLCVLGQLFILLSFVTNVALTVVFVAMCTLSYLVCNLSVSMLTGVCIAVVSKCRLRVFI